MSDLQRPPAAADRQPSVASSSQGSQHSNTNPYTARSGASVASPVPVWTPQNPYTIGASAGNASAQDHDTNGDPLHRQPSIISRIISRTSHNTSHNPHSPSSPHLSHPGYYSKEEEVGMQHNHHNDDKRGMLETVKEESEDEESSEDEVQDLKEATLGLETAEHGEAVLSPSQRGFRKHLVTAKQKRRHVYHSPFVKALRSMWLYLVHRTLITQCFAYWLPLAIVFFIPLAVGAWGRPDAELGHTRIFWIFVWLEIFWGSLWTSRLVAHVVPEIYVVVVGIFAPKWRKWASVIQAMEFALTFFFWALVSFITFIPVITHNAKAEAKSSSAIEKWQSVIQNILVAFLITSLVYFVERLFIQLISVSFHRTRFSARIKESKAAVKGLTALLNASYDIFPPGCAEFAEEDRDLESGPLLAKAANVIGGEKFQRTQVRKMVGKFNVTVGAVSRQIQEALRNSSGAVTPHGFTAQTVVTDALSSKRLAETLAKRVWMSLVLEGSEELTLDDLKEVLGAAHHEEAEALFDMMDGDESGGVSLEEMVNAVVDIYRKRKNIYKSLKDVDTAIEKLHSVLLFFVGIIIIIIFVGMLAPSVSTVLATFGSTILGLSFVFSVTCQEFLGSCIFVFVKHPYDTGDTVTVFAGTSPAAAVTMIVTDVNLLYTTFKVLGSNLYTQLPNNVLNTYTIQNTSRSGPMACTYTLTLGLPETTLEDIEVFKFRFSQFIEDHPKDYLKGVWYSTDFDDLDKLTFQINFSYKNNFSDTTVLARRKDAAISYIGLLVREIPLQIPRRDDTYNNPSLPMVTQARTSPTAEMQRQEVLCREDLEAAAKIYGTSALVTSSGRRRPMPRAPVGMTKPSVSDITIEDHNGEEEEAIEDSNSADFEVGNRNTDSTLDRTKSMSSRVSRASRASVTLGRTTTLGRRRKYESKTDM